MLMSTFIGASSGWEYVVTSLTSLLNVVYFLFVEILNEVDFFYVYECW